MAIVERERRQGARQPAEFMMQRMFRASLALAFLMGLRANAPAQDQALIEAGKMVYAMHCAECHGDNLRDPGAFPDLRELRADARAYFDQTVMEGRGQMPTWRGVVDEQQLDALWAYIRANALP